MSPFWGSFEGTTKFTPTLWRWAEKSDTSIYLKNEKFITLRNSLIPYYFSEDGWNISQRQRVHVLIENGLAGKDNRVSWETHAGLIWSFNNCSEEGPDCYRQGLYNLHETLKFSEASRYLPLYHLAWDDKVDNPITFPLQDKPYNLGSNKKRKKFWRQLHNCLYTRSKEYQSVRFTQIDKNYNTSCLDETQADSNIRKGEI